MPNTATGTLETIALELGKAIEPLKDILTPDIVERLGIRTPAAFKTDVQIINEFSAAATKIQPLVVDVAALVVEVSKPTPNKNQIVALGKNVITKIKALVESLITVGNTISAKSNLFPTPAEQAAATTLGGELAKRILQYLLVEYLNNKAPNLNALLKIAGIVTDEQTEENTLTFQKKTFEFERLPTFLSNPEQHIKNVYKFGASSFDGQIMLHRIKQLLESYGQTADIYQAIGTPLTLEAHFLSLQFTPSVSNPSLTLNVRIPADNNFNEEIRITDLWKARVKISTKFNAGVGGKITPPFQIELTAPLSSNLAIDFLFDLKAEKEDGTKTLLIGSTTGTRLETQSIGTGLGFALNLSGLSPTDQAEPTIRIAVAGGKLVVDLREGDGFIQSILGGLRLESNFDFMGHWSPKKGLRLQGSGAVELFIPVHINLGIVEIGGLYLVVGFGTDAPLQLEVATQLKTNLGPLKAIVDRIGTKMPMKFPAKGDGNLGVMDLAFDFSPPKGIGLSLDGSVFKGGGFLYFNPEKGEYGGVLELEFKSMFTLKAIGILNTKMPDGTEGFSLIIIITAEFTPIQLGFGFTLLGVGGLLGLNRTMNVQKLAAGVKDGSLNYILFPTDPVANAPTIIAAIGQIFPPKNGQFIFGPMGKIGWGTPTLISLELGLLIEVANPVRIAILGVIRCILPEEHLPILKLQVNFIGVLDLEKKELFFYASIFDSQLLAFTLAGDMLLLVNWSDDKANFILSVGGFHPAFTPPPLPVPPLSRLSISLLDGDNPRLRLETFFAVTSNTVQLGAKLELYASVGPASIDGMLGFDLLFQFSPFRFIAHIFAGLKAKIFDITLFAVGLDFTLEGPTPWRAHGTATVSVSFFFFSISIDIGFDVTWGDRNDTVFPSINVSSILQKAFADRRNWEAALPPNAHQQISLRELPITEGTPPATVPLIVHPFGILSVSQKAVPLKQLIEVVGNQPVEDALKTFKIDNVSANGATLLFSDVVDEFAPAQYLKMTDDQKLTRKSFEQMASGVRIAGTDAFSVGASAVRMVRYDFKYLTKKKLVRAFSKLRYLRSELFTALLRGNAIAQSPLSHAARQKTALAPKDIVFKPEQFVVASSDTLKAMSAAHVFNTESAAYAALQQMQLEKPALKGNIQVVAAYQM